MDIINFLNQHPHCFIAIIIFLSLMVGSFLNVVIHRLPRMIINEWNQECREYLGLKATEEPKKPLNLSLPASHCPSCEKPLKFWHNIPLISYFLLAGKCAFCKTTIPFRYPFVELLTCVTSVYVAWRFGVSWQMAGALLFTWILIALTFIDLDYQLLPDHLTYLLLGIGLTLSLSNIFVDSHEAIIGTVAGYLVFAITQWIFHLLTGKIGMGQGDYKLLAAIGAFVGWHLLPVIILLGSISGVIFGVTFMVIKRDFKSVPLPFGPYLAVAGWISLMWGNDILQYYLYLFQ